jgi:hypothetical protein
LIRPPPGSGSSFAIEPRIPQGSFKCTHKFFHHSITSFVQTDVACCVCTVHRWNHGIMEYWNNGMKYISLVVIVVLFLCSQCVESYSEEQVTISHLNELYEAERYFKLDSYYSNNKSKLSKKYRAYFDVIVCNIFIDTEACAKALNTIARQYYEDLSKDEKLVYHSEKREYLIRT